MEIKNKELLKECFPSHRLEDVRDFQLQQFTAEDMIEFAHSIAKASLEKAYNNAEYELIIYTDDYEVTKESITSESNIVLL